MKSAPFTYHAPRTLGEALVLKRELGDQARVLAGGQSLMPLMHLRLATPAHLIDINRIDELNYIRTADGHLVIGALTRQMEAMSSVVVAEKSPLLKETIGLVGHAQIRHRGTIAGSVAHADPSAEIPATLLAMGGELVARSASDERLVGAADFFLGPFTTALSEDEIITEVRVPVWPEGTGSAFLELSRIYHGFPVVGVAALVHLSDGRIDRAAVALCGMSGTAIRAPGAEQVLVGSEPTVDLVAEAGDAAVAGFDPPGDVHGSGEYRRKVGRAYVRRTLQAAFDRAGGGR